MNFVFQLAIFFLFSFVTQFTLYNTTHCIIQLRLNFWEQSCANKKTHQLIIRTSNLRCSLIHNQNTCLSLSEGISSCPPPTSLPRLQTLRRRHTGQLINQKIFQNHIFCTLNYKKSAGCASGTQGTHECTQTLVMLFSEQKKSEEFLPNYRSSISISLYVTA